MSKRTSAEFSEETNLKNQVLMQEVRRFSDARRHETGLAPRYFIDTYGCQMNEHDSEKLRGMLDLMGYSEGTGFKDADLILINTCCVRENAELKVYGNLGHLKSLKRKRRDLKVAVCGCMMQQPDIVEEIRRKYPHVDLIFGTHNLHRFPELLLTTFQSPSPVVEVWESEGQIVEGLPTARRKGLKAYVNIMFGCDNFCTYCIVPYTRGRERSREPEEILREIRDLAAEGVQEVTLLGQNVNSYGAGLDPAVDFADLLRAVDAVPGIERIRFMTSHPKDVSDKLIQAIAECPHVCEQMHLPVQAGSNALLKRMNRSYTREDYLDLVRRFRTAVPDITLSTDIIIGFPGETEEDVEALLDLIREVRFNNAFTFIYSPRKGTPAAEMEDQVPEPVKHQRFSRMLEEMNRLVMEANQQMLGVVVEVLAEEESLQEPGQITGRSRGNHVVRFKGTAEDIGQRVQVRITEPRSFTLLGEKC